MDYVSIASQKFMTAENLADSTGLEKDRLQMFSDDLDKDHRYAIVCQAISKEDEHDPNYQLSNPIKKRYWVPLKVKVGEEEPRWVLVNKASLHKRFGMSYADIDAGVKAGNLSDKVATRANSIKKFLINDFLYKPEGKFIKAAAQKLTDSSGEVKDRYKFFANDKNNEYAIHYKPVDQPEDRSIPKLSSAQKKYWIPYIVENEDGSSTWILLNKSSLIKRFNIPEKDLDVALESVHVLNRFGIQGVTNAAKKRLSLNAIRKEMQKAWTPVLQVSGGSLKKMMKAITKAEEDMKPELIKYSKYSTDVPERIMRKIVNLKQIIGDLQKSGINEVERSKMQQIIRIIDEVQEALFA